MLSFANIRQNIINKFNIIGLYMFNMISFDNFDFLGFLSSNSLDFQKCLKDKKMT